MPPPHGSRVLPAVPLAAAGGGEPSGVTGDRTRGRHASRALAPRAVRALAASLALAAFGLSAAVFVGNAQAATAAPTAAGRRGAQNEVNIAIIGMTPQQAGPGATITVRGTVSNRTRQPVSNLSVQLLGSSTPVSTSAELQSDTTAQDDPASTALPGGTWKSKAALQPGSQAHWIVKVKANSIGMTTFGVYPLTAEAQNALTQQTLAATTTYLPYVPAKNGPYGRSIPARTKISWVLPLIDKPELDKPWQDPCQGTQAQALATSLGSDGRLGQLVAAGQDSVGTADVYSASGLGRGLQNRAIRSEPMQSLSSYDGITWAIDPALLENVRALASCSGSHARWASAAHGWLSELRQITSAEPVFVTPYADPDVAALLNQRHQSDAESSITLGTAIGQHILRRNLGSLVASARSLGTLSPAAGVAWPAGGISGYSTVEFLASQDVHTLLLSSSAMPAERSRTVLRVASSAGGYMNVLLANSPLTQLLAAAGNTPGSEFATEQDFLAQTALAAEANPGAPVIVAPPRRFDPAAGVTAGLLAETASASWLNPVSLPSLTTGKDIPRVPSSAFANSPARISRHELQKLTTVDDGIAQLQNMAADQFNNVSYWFPLAIATVESSAYQGRAESSAMAMLRTLTSEIAQQDQEVQVFAEPRVTLGGLKGSVPVSIDNRLGYTVMVRLQLSYSQATGIKITADPGGLVPVPAGQAVTVRLHVQATKVGSTSVTMSLVNSGNQPLTVPNQSVSMTIEATQVGVLGVIICAAALGVVLIAYAARAVRRGRPTGGAEQPADPSPAADQGDDRSTAPAEADTVMAERSELGAAGAPGP